jgi:hypothetical protein
MSNFTTAKKGSGQIIMVVKELSHHNRDELFLIIMCQAAAKDKLNMGGLGAQNAKVKCSPSLLPKVFLQLSHLQLLEHPTPPFYST